MNAINIYGPLLSSVYYIEINANIDLASNWETSEAKAVLAYPIKTSTTLKH
jgi:hypothetical protein